MARKRRPFLSLRHRLEAAVWSSAEAALGWTPDRALPALARAFARIAFDILRLRRAVTLSNLSLAFPEWTDRQRISVGRACFEHAIYGVAEFSHLTRPGALQSAKVRVEVVDEHRTLERLQHQPLVITVGHLGSWEFLPHYWGMRGVQLGILYKPMHNPFVDARFLRQRQTSNARYISTRLAPRQMWAALRAAVDEGRNLVFLADQDARRDGVFVPFFGKPASTATGPATVAARMNLPIIPVSCIRTGLWQFRLEIGAAIEPPPGGRSSETVRWLTEQHAAALEASIRQAPEQYMWFHQRWKSRPRRSAVQPEAVR